MAFKIGDGVRQKVVPVVGTVRSTQYNETEERLEHLVESEDGSQAIWLPADQLESQAEEVQA